MSNAMYANPMKEDSLHKQNNPLFFPRNWRWWRGLRDIIIFDKQKNIIKNEFFDLDENTLVYLFSVDERKDEVIEIMGHHYLVLRRNIEWGTIFFFRDLTPLQSFHITLTVIALLWSLLWLIVIYLLSRYLARITIEPIREQSKELEAYSHNVAHELRTPLSIMKSNLELLRMKPESRFIDSTDEEIIGMERIIESLLFLAKPNWTDEKKQLDITKKTEEIIEKYKDENSIKYTHEKKHLWKEANEELYTRVLCNLIENAIKYKSVWDITVVINKNSIIITNTIENNLSDDERRKITKVFYQWDTSRNSTGYWLGLALVKKIVEISGWTMDIITKERKFSVIIRF